MYARCLYTIQRDLVRTGFLRAKDNNVVSDDEVEEASSLVARLIAPEHEAEAQPSWRSAVALSSLAAH